MSTSGILRQIDQAIDDWTVSCDAMRSGAPGDVVEEEAPRRLVRVVPGPPGCVSVVIDVDTSAVDASLARAVRAHRRTRDRGKRR